MRKMGAYNIKDSYFDDYQNYPVEFSRKKNQVSEKDHSLGCLVGSSGLVKE